MNHHICKTCGATLVRRDEFTWECKYCKNTYEDSLVVSETLAMRKVLDEEKLARVANLRQGLYKELTARIFDRDKITEYCTSLKKYLPNDFEASFFDTLANGTPEEISEALSDVDVREHAPYIDLIINATVRDIRDSYLLPLDGIIERAYKKSDMEKYKRFKTLVEDEMQKVDSGVYVPSIARDVFVAYSSADIKKVEELARVFDENGITYFIAAKNLRHGIHAKERYEPDLKTAMSKCKVFVFISSRSSRNGSCDAFTFELAYVRECDEKAYPGGFNNYASIPDKYKKPRIEYRIEDSRHTTVVDEDVAEFFKGYEYCGTANEVVRRVISYKKSFAIADDTKTEVPQKNKKYCSACGYANDKGAKFCSDCKHDKFVPTYDDYLKLKKQREEDNSKDKEIARLRQEKAALEKKKADNKRIASENVFKISLAVVLSVALLGGIFFGGKALFDNVNFAAMGWGVWQWVVGALALGALIAVGHIILKHDVEVIPGVLSFSAVSLIGVIASLVLPETFSVICAFISLGLAYDLFIIMKSDLYYSVNSIGAVVLTADLVTAFTCFFGKPELGVWLVYFIGIVAIAALAATIMHLKDVENIAVYALPIAFIVLHLLMYLIVPHFMHSINEMPTPAVNSENGEAICSCDEEIKLSAVAENFIHVLHGLETRPTKANNDARHWTVCSCGDAFRFEEHNYKNGVCSSCGYKDENYKAPVVTDPTVTDPADTSENGTDLVDQQVEAAEIWISYVFGVGFAFFIMFFVYFAGEESEELGIIVCTVISFIFTVLILSLSGLWARAFSFFVLTCGILLFVFTMRGKHDNKFGFGAVVMGIDGVTFILSFLGRPNPIVWLVCAGLMAVISTIIVIKLYRSRDQELATGIIGGSCVGLLAIYIILLIIFPHFNHYADGLPKPAILSENGEATCSCGDEIILPGWLENMIHTLNHNYNDSIDPGVGYNDTHHWKICECGDAYKFWPHSFNGTRCRTCGYISSDYSEIFEDDAEAIYKEATNYYYGVNGYAKDVDKAIEMLKKAAELGSGDAMMSLGDHYYYHLPIDEKDFVEAVRWYQAGADIDHARSCDALATMYAYGFGVDADTQKADELYERAASLGYSYALIRLGIMYERNGLDYAKALDSYERAAAAGERSAGYKIGYMYDEGRGVEQNNDKAMEWYKKSADMGYSSAMVNLGAMYYNGQGTEVDYTTALSLFERAAELENSGGYNWLGWMYEHGSGVEVDITRAVSLYTKASEMGSGNATYHLANCYRDGKGVEKNIEKARELYNKAVSLGEELAKDALEKLDK